MKAKRKGILAAAAVLLVTSVVTLTFWGGAHALIQTEGTHEADAPSALIPAPKQDPDAGNGLPVMRATADFAVVYGSVGQLYQAADVVVRGEVVEVSYLDFNATAYTNVLFRVTKCLKGDLVAGELITIAEVGGITSLATLVQDKFGPAREAEAGRKVQVQLEGAPLAGVGDRCLYFLGTGSIGVVPGAYYVPLGAFQGRFKIDNGLATRFVPADWQDEDYTALPIAEVTLDQAVIGASTE